MLKGISYRGMGCLLAPIVVVLVLTAYSPVLASSNAQEYEQVGAYFKLENAATMVETFRLEGKNAFVRQKVINGKVIYAVVIDHSAPLAAPEEPGTSTVVVENAEPLSAEPAEAPQVDPYAGAAAVAVTPEPESTPESAQDESAEATAEPDEGDAAAMGVAAMGAAVSEGAELAGAGASAVESADMAQAVEGEPEETADMDEPSSASEENPPRLVVVPVTSEEKTQSIEIMSNAELYDRPFETGNAIGTYEELGGVYIKEYLGWYALRLPDGKFGFIRKEDGNPVGSPSKGSDEVRMGQAGGAGV